MLELNYKDYLNKVHGGWIGKCIGGAIGAMQENNKSLMDYTVENVFPGTIPPNDDLDLQVLWLQEILEKKGPVFSSEDIAKAFAGYNLEIVNEYAVAIKNIELGIMPPVSGIFNNAYFKNSMGCPIRSEIWGFICPGNPEAAVRFAQLDGAVDHDTESINGEKLLAAMEAGAFFIQDIPELIEAGLKYIPEGSTLAGCISFVSKLYLAGIPWKDARNKLVKKYGSADASYSVVNIGVIILALFYGKGDFTETLMIAVNSGFDTDCTAATAGAILGQMIGAEQIPEFWKSKIGKEVIIGTVAIRRYSNLIEDLARDTCAVGLGLMRDGMLTTRILDIPENVRITLPLPCKIPEVDMEVEYSGRPAIGYGETANAMLIIKNNTDCVQTGTVLIETPAHMDVNIRKTDLSLEPQTESRMPLEFQVKKDTAVLPQKNIIHAAFCKKDHKGIPGRSCEVIKKGFGLSGACRMKMMGPFFDHYDTRVYKCDPYQGKRQQLADGSLDLFAMFNGFVDIDKPYINEAFDNIACEEGEDVNFYEDKLEIDEKVSYQGPCCVYLVHDFLCPEEMEDAFLLIGNNDSYKLWLNGELIACDREKRMWMPLNKRVKISLTSGKNRIIMKVVRSGSSFEFSLVMGSPKYKDHFLVNLGSRIETK